LPAEVSTGDRPGLAGNQRDGVHQVAISALPAVVPGKAIIGESRQRVKRRSSAGRPSHRHHTAADTR
jgi:hypothetical protein